MNKNELWNLVLKFNSKNEIIKLNEEEKKVLEKANISEMDFTMAVTDLPEFMNIPQIAEQWKK